MISSKEVCQEYNFSGNQEVSISELVDDICKLSKTERNQIVKNGPDRPGKDAHYRLNCEKAKEKLDWVPNVSLNEGLKEVYDWLLSNKENLSLYSWDYIHKK